MATDPRLSERAVTTSAPFDLFNYRLDAGWSADHDLVGYRVEATNGQVGKVDEASHATDGSYLVVKTGALFGRRLMIPAGIVNHIDHDDRRVYLDRAKEQVSGGPAFDPDSYTEPEYHRQLGGYYEGSDRPV